MQSTEKIDILTLQPFFKAVCKVISAFFVGFSKISRDFAEKNNDNEGLLSNQTMVYSLNNTKAFEKLKKESGLLINPSNKALNTATVYIHGSNHNLVYATSACRLHPGPTLYTQHSFWRTTGR